MQGAFSRGSVPDRRRAGKCRHSPIAGGVLPCREPSAGEASPTADAQGSAGIPPSPGACFHAGSLQPGKRPRPPTRREVPAFPHRRGACFHAGSLQPGKRPRPPTRREVPAFPHRRGRASMQGAFSRGSVPDRRRAGKCRHSPIAGGVLPCREPSAGEASPTADAQGSAGIPPSPGACFHAGSLQPGKRPRPPTRREVPAFPHRRGRASMQGAFSRGSVPDRRRAGKCRHSPIAGGVLPCREPSAGEASPTADAQGSAGIPPSPGACFHAGSLQPGKHPRPLTRREVRACPRRRRRTSMQGKRRRTVPAPGRSGERKRRKKASSCAATAGAPVRARRQPVGPRRLGEVRQGDGRLGLGQEALSDGNGSCGASAVCEGLPAATLQACALVSPIPTQGIRPLAQGRCARSYLPPATTKEARRHGRARLAARKEGGTPSLRRDCPWGALVSLRKAVGDDLSAVCPPGKRKPAPATV